MFFTLLFMLTTDSFSIRPFYQGDYWHLWFLPMLFWCFVFGLIIGKVVVNKPFYISLIVLSVFFALIFIPFRAPAVFGLNALKNWLFWFFGGMVTMRYDKIVFNFIRRFHLVWGLIAVNLMIQLYTPTLYENYTVWKLIASVSGVYAIWYVTRIIPWNNFAFTDILLMLSSCSFGIYIFHNWIEMLLLSKSIQRIIPIERFAFDNPWLSPFIFVAFAFTISFGLTYCIRLSKIGRHLI